MSSNRTRQIASSGSGGVGVMADDAMAAVYANLALRLVALIWRWI